MIRFCLSLLALAPVVVAPARGGADGAHSCFSRVIDPDHLLTADQSSDILNDAKLLANQVPADYHIILLRTTEQDVRVAAEDYCPEWKPGPRRTPNLLVVANAPNERRGAVFYGDALAAKLDDRWREVFDPTINPYYRQNKLARGVIETTARLRMILAPGEAAAPQKAEAPVATPEPETSTPTPNPWDDPMDKLVGWVFWSMPWVFGFAVLSFLWKAVFGNSPSSEARAARHEQELAKAKLQLVRDKSANVDHDLTATALKGLEVGALGKEYDKILDDSAWLQLKCDPLHDGLPASEYADMRAQYERIYQRFDRITQTLRAKRETLPRFDGFRANHVGPTDASGRPQQPGSSPVPPIIHQHPDGGLAAGLIIGSLLSSDHHHEQSESSRALFDRREDGALWGNGDTGGSADYGSSSGNDSGASDTGGAGGYDSGSSGGDTGGSVDV